MDAISSHKVATDQLIRQEVQNTPVVKYFPICDSQELKILDEKITSAKRDVYESAISSILCNNIKNITQILKTDVITSVNVDGSHGKNGLKSFLNFYSALTGAVAKLPHKGLTPEDRKGLQFEKAKYFKKVYIQKKNLEAYTSL